MDEEMRAYLDAMQQSLNGMQQRMNDSHERILNKIASLEQDFGNTKGFLISDAIVSGRRWFDLDERVTRIERNQKS